MVLLSQIRVSSGIIARRADGCPVRRSGKNAEPASLGQSGGRQFRKSSRPDARMSNYLRIGSRRIFPHGAAQQGNSSSTRRFYARGGPIPPWSGPPRIAIPLLLIAPAIWNGYPLLQCDTGGYLARWYEGYLVPSRSTVFGLYLHFGAGIVLLDQSRDSGAGDAVDPAADAKSVRHADAVSHRGHQPRTDPDHRAALARQHAADRHLCRAGDPVAVPARRAWRPDLVDREMAAVRVHIVRRRHPQRNARRAAWPVLRRLDGAAISALHEFPRPGWCRAASPSLPAR